MKGAASVLALAAVLSAVAFPASSQTFFDRLFGGRAQQQRTVQPQAEVSPPATPAGATRAMKPVPVKKVSAPSFYNYKPAALVALDLASLKAALKPLPETGAASEAEQEFRAALDALQAFDLRVEKAVAEAVVSHYAKHPQFVWVDANGPTERAGRVLDLLDRAEEYGLNGSDYSVSKPRLAQASDEEGRSRRLQEMLRFELALSAKALRYARDAHMGRVDPNKLSGFHDFKPKAMDPGVVLGILTGSGSPERYLQSLHPQNEEFAALKAELARLRAEAADDDEVVVDANLLLKPGGSHPDFPKLLRLIDRPADENIREEHGAVLAALAGSDTYSSELVPVIKAVQRQHNLNPDGIIGRRTVSMLAGENRSAKIQKILLSMERLRWHPSHLGSTRVVLNVPSFTVVFFENGQEKLNMRTVVGSTTNQTHFFHDEIEYVEFNPYWGVPRSILVNEKLPRLRSDPGYLDRAGYEVFDRNGKRVSSASIDWNQYGSNVPFSVRQKPGPSNSLGELKIMFPNSHDIYMHDTPQKHLFSGDVRAFSHGCVRLEDPRAMAAAVLGVSKEEVGKMIAGGKNSRRNVPVKIPVYVAYFTAWPDASGNIGYFDDIYGRDAHLAKALTAVADLRSAGS